MRGAPLADRHHVFHERTWYVSRHDQALRQNHLFIPRMSYEAHHAGFPNGLHENLPPPPKPNHELVCGALVVAQEFWRGMESPEAIKRIAGFFESVKNGNADLAHRIADNIFSQLIYIEEGYLPLEDVA